ncbi:MAG TPA: radical SAM protein [Candidatus Eisenbacteria bacterium]
MTSASVEPAAPPAESALADEPKAPLQPLFHLDALWIQVAGTLCNLSCTHCFVSSGPGDDHHALMPRAEVRRHVEDGLALGAKEFYFTGGEPFVHPEMLGIIADTLADGPVTVLTNGTLFTPRRIEALRRLREGAHYSLEIRVSLDGASAAEHDRFRGAGSFARAMDGIVRLSAAGFLPIVTVTQVAGEDPLHLRTRVHELLRGSGIERPRIKLLPMFLLGREAGRTRSYQPAETLAGLAPEAFDPHRLQCSSCRAVTSRGVFVCPLLVDEPAGRMGERLADALGPFALGHGACTTCYATGMTCGNG